MSGEELLKYGFEASIAKKAAESKTLPAVLEQIVVEGSISKEVVANAGSLIVLFASTLPKTRSDHRAAVSKLIAAKQVRTPAQVSAAVEYLKTLLPGSALDEAVLKDKCGAGVVVSAAEIEATVAKILKDNDAMLKEERYRARGKVLGQVTKALKWADPKDLVDAFDKHLLAVLGPKTEDDHKPLVKAKKPAADGKAAAAAAAAPAVEVKSSNKTLLGGDAGDEDPLAEGREIPESINSAEALKRHRAATGGMTITRFPPEPNGFLHLGHAKAMRFNFSVAAARGGKTILRYDDTNPEAEKELYIDKIEEAVKWLGYTPAEINYSSDYFPKLYELAVDLIKRGFAYVDHQTGKEIEEYRSKCLNSPWRNRSVEENLRLFEDMRKGKYDEGTATLRMKGDMTHPMPTMRDLVAYRIKYAPHPHVKDLWCIYPTYDYTHCIIDSLENITHSLCTLEFEVRRESYFWLLHVLDLYKPKVWEYSRLNLEYNVMSKRKLKQLVEDKLVSDWDDPRLLTLMGLRRRGLTPEIINTFCDRVGVSRNANTIRQELLDFCTRDVLNNVASRAMVIKDPVRVTLSNYPAGKVESVKAPVFPHSMEKGFRDLPFSRVLYIDRDDFRTADEPGFYRLVPGKTVHLLYAYNITCTSFSANAEGVVTDIVATVDLDSLLSIDHKDKDAAAEAKDKSKKVKGNLHWVAEPKPGQAPFSVELRLYDRLFTIPEPAGADDWLSHLNPKSLVVVPSAYAEPSLRNAKSEDKFQFERVGYFCADSRDHSAAHAVFNLTISLREDRDKPATAAAAAAATTAKPASAKAKKK